MSEIHRLQNPYSINKNVESALQGGQHREIIGGMWDEIGALQLEFLKERGLKPQHKLLDIGCGSLRLGVQAIDYLEPGNYFGSDMHESLVRTGYEKELNENQRRRQPWENFGFNEDFDFSFLPGQMDYAIAQSVFTHVPWNAIRRCIIRLGPHMKKGGIFFATFFECPAEHDITTPYSQGAVVTRDDHDPFHYYREDMLATAVHSDWEFQYIGDWQHPRNQKMAAYVRK